MLLRKPTSAFVTTRASLQTARAGFTLMELLVVIAILVVLIGVATPMYLSYLEKSKLRLARTTADTLSKTLKAYALEHDGAYPPVGDWSQVPLEKNPPLDPWNQVYQWQLMPIVVGDSEVMTPVVWSGGPAGNFGPNDKCSSLYQGQ
jgi:prepilin-type N-terminal cleavage/methylation domain-containing protein